MIDLSVIIVCYKGYKRLKQCLDSLALFKETQSNCLCGMKRKAHGAQEPRHIERYVEVSSTAQRSDSPAQAITQSFLKGESVKIEVILVNNCPGDDEFYDLLKNYPDFRHIENSINGGYGNGCNLGASIAGGSFFLILNPDTIVAEHALVELVDFLKSNPSITAASCRQVNENGKECRAHGAFPGFLNLTGFMRILFSSRNKNRMKRREGFSSEILFPDWISGSAILIRQDDYKRLNGFDEDFWMYFEDVELCRRIKRSGGEIAFCTNITIEHNHGGSTRINMKTASITKAEALISKHLYISKDTSGFKKIFIQSFLVISNIVSLIPAAAAGLIFFFIPKLFLRFNILKNIVIYYCGSLSSGSWISPRSVNHVMKV